MVGEGERAAVDPEAAKLRSNFVWFVTFFALNHGVVTTPVVIATSILDKRTAYTGNALLNVFTLLSALFFGAPAVSIMGLKGAVLFGMMFYCIYAGFFSLATFGHDAGWSPQLEFTIFSIGSSCGGIAAGVLWTAQGGYMSRTIDLVLAREGRAQEDGSGAGRAARQALTAQFSSMFAFRYLGIEVAAKLLWSALDKSGLQKWIIAALYASVGMFALLMQVKALPLATVETAAPEAGRAPAWASKLLAAAGEWKDPCIFLLAGSNLTFGFCAAYMNGYVNGTYGKALGTFAPTLLAAITVLTATLASRAFGPLAARVGKGPVVLLGACCFATIPVLLLIPGGCCETWGWWLAVLYVLQGTGRAVYESTNKGVFADFFPAPRDVGAFANVMLQSSSAFALCFFLSEELAPKPLAVIVLLLALFTPLGFAAATAVKQRREARERLGLMTAEAYSGS